MDARSANDMLEGKSIAFKNELLFTRGINFDKLPSWQKRGIGVHWADVEKAGFTPITKQEVTAIRRGLLVDYELPFGEKYAQYISAFLESET